jgi:error-prone DNA polymerase
VEYAELHCHFHFSFREGASPVGSLLARAMELGYSALALTDHDNLSGAMRFARSGKALRVKSIIGCELNLKGGHHLTVLAETARATPISANFFPSAMSWPRSAPSRS